MHSCVTSKNVKWCHLIWPTLYIVCSQQVVRGTSELLRGTIYEAAAQLRGNVVYVRFLNYTCVTNSQSLDRLPHMILMQWQSNVMTMCIVELR